MRSRCARGEPLQPRRLDIGRMPAHVELAGQARGGAHRLRRRPRAGRRRRGSRPRCSRPAGGRAGLLHAPAAHVVFHMLGGAAQRDLAQRDEVALAEEVLRRALGLLRQVDLAGREPRSQFVGRDVDQHHLVGLVEHGVGHGLVHAHAGDGADRAVQAFQVLHVERRPDVDAGGQQLLHVLPALGMARARRVGVRQFVDQQHRGLARQRGVEVELGAACGRGTAPARSGSCSRPASSAAVSLRPCVSTTPTTHVAPGRPLALRRAQHRPGLADAGAGAEVDAQLAAPRALPRPARSCASSASGSGRTSASRGPWCAGSSA